MNTPERSPLGRSIAYQGRYDPRLLYPIPRAPARTALGLHPEATDSLPFHGVDIWNAYELSWLDRRGRPRVMLAEFRVPANSANLIESKSLKLYLNSFTRTVFDTADAVRAVIREDLSEAAEAPVSVVLAPVAGALRAEALVGDCIDDLAITLDHYGPPKPEFLLVDDESRAEERLVSHLLKSNCPVTGQPDWASIQIAYAGPRIDRAGLLRYLVSFREHAEFHEHCVERIFLDLLTRCATVRLSVQARYTRRGGLDINPWRSSERAGEPNNTRTLRQ